MSIRNFGDDRTTMCFEGATTGLPSSAQRLGKVILHVLDSQGVEGVCVSFNCAKSAATDAWEISVIDGWRICFVWKGGDAYDVEIVDYH